MNNEIIQKPNPLIGKKVPRKDDPTISDEIATAELLQNVAAYVITFTSDRSPEFLSIIAASKIIGN